MEIVQNEEYLQGVDFDEIKRYDVQKRIGNLESQKLNLRKGRKHKGQNPRKHPEKSSRKKSGKIPDKILQKNEDNSQNKKNKVKQERCEIFPS